jgi:hypothetical protein
MADDPGAAVNRTTLHGAFTVERDLAAAPDRVYAAYADVSVRRRWFRMPGDPSRALHELDFRVGGRGRPAAPARETRRYGAGRIRSGLGVTAVSDSDEGFLPGPGVAVLRDGEPEVAAEGR